MDKYESIRKTFADHECQLLTTYETYIENKLDKTKYPQFKIIAICGHIVPNCWFHMFKYRGTGLLCKDCTDNNHKEHNTNLQVDAVICKDTFNNYTFIIENNSIELIRKYSQNYIKLHKTNECCLADIMIQPMNIEQNKWLPIQVKATLVGRHNIYSFGVYNKYPNMLIILICIEDEKFWIINGNTVLNQCKISIGMKKSNKYSKFCVNKEQLGNKLVELYNSNMYEYYTREYINTPITLCCQLEQQYRYMREMYLPNIEFIYSKLPQQVYDFTINGKKVQEKLAHHYKNKNPSTRLTKNKHGIKNQPYELGNNDYYWINMPDKIHFYIIPEYILEKENIISTKITKGNCSITFSNNWTLPYRYVYTTSNIEDIIHKIFYK